MAKLIGLRLRGLASEYQYEEEGEPAEGGELFAEDLAADLGEGYPGVPGVKLVVNSARVEGEDVLMDVDLDPREWVRHSHALGVDDLETLQDLKDAGLPAGELDDLVAWMRSDESGLTTAWIVAEGGELTADSFPSKADL